MDYQVSARKWRPQTFEEVIGQEHVTKSLSNAIRLKKIAQAYLFSGIRGVGKTSLARILAKGVNCKKEGTSVPCNSCESCLEITAGQSVDVIEIDGASNTGVDDVRELRENIKYLPLRGRYKVYIIDEVHMLSNAAFNALLKTLEEPPPHLIFILATTESHKIPGTILSRCQHFAFRRMSTSEIVIQLKIVIEAREIEFTARGLNLIARVAEGSMRDALSLIDQAISFGGASVTDENLLTLLGRMDGVTFHHLIEAIHQKDAAAALAVANEITDQGCDLKQFLTDWLEHLRHLIVAQNVSDAGLWVDLSKEEVEEIKTESALFSLEAMQRLFSLFAKLLSEIRNAPQPNLLFEVSLMKAILLADTQSIENIIEKLDQLTTREVLPDTIMETPTKPIYQTSNHTPYVPEKKLEKKEEPTRTASLPPQNKTSPAPTYRDGENTSIKATPALPNGTAGWQKILTIIKQERPNVSSYLEQGRLENFDDKEIRIGFPKNSVFLIPLIEKAETQKWLNHLLKKHLHRTVKLNLLKNEDAEPNPDPLEKPNRMEDRFEHNKSGSEHPLIQEALKTLGGSVIETKRVLND